MTTALFASAILAELCPGVAPAGAQESPGLGTGYYFAWAFTQDAIPASGPDPTVWRFSGLATGSLTIGPTSYAGQLDFSIDASGSDDVHGGSGVITGGHVLNMPGTGSVSGNVLGGTYNRTETALRMTVNLDLEVCDPLVAAGCKGTRTPPSSSPARSSCRHPAVGATLATSNPPTHRRRTSPRPTPPP